jgi:hypothetical protein
MGLRPLPRTLISVERVVRSVEASLYPVNWSPQCWRSCFRGSETKGGWWVVSWKAMGEGWLGLQMSVIRVLFACSCPLVFLLSCWRDSRFTVCTFALSSFSLVVPESVVTLKVHVEGVLRNTYSSTETSSCTVNSPGNKVGTVLYARSCAKLKKQIAYI